VCLFFIFFWKLLKKPEYFDVYPKCELTPKNVVFAFDLHDVVVHINLVRLVQMLINTDEGRKMCWTILKPKILWAFLVHAGTWGLSHFTGEKGVVVEELFFRVADQYPELAKYSSFFAKVANSFDIDPKTQDIIHQLKQKGYSVYLFSNIGSRFFDDMKQQYPWLDQFDAHMFSSKIDGYLKKPNKEYYKLFYERYLTEDKLIIFIDDHVNNLKFAVDSHYGHRFHPIRFTNAENLSQLLQKWRIL